MKNEYTQQANNFLTRTGATLSIEYAGITTPPWGGEKVFSFDCILKRKNREYTFKFYDLIHDIINFKKNNVKPSSYDVLERLQKKYFETLKDFCDYYLCDEDSVKIRGIYESCNDQVLNLQVLFNEEELELLREIN